MEKLIVQAFTASEIISTTPVALKEKFGFRAKVGREAQVQMELPRTLAFELWGRLGIYLGRLAAFDIRQACPLTTKSVSYTILEELDGVRIFLHGSEGPELFFDMPTDAVRKMFRAVLRDIPEPETGHARH